MARMTLVRIKRQQNTHEGKNGIYSMEFRLMTIHFVRMETYLTTGGNRCSIWIGNCPQSVQSFYYDLQVL